MSRISRLDYAYADGRVRALEKHLIQRAVFHEAAAAADFSAALKIVYDAGRYPDDLIKVRDTEDLDAVLGLEEARLKSEIAELIPEEDVRDAFLLADDREKALAAAVRSGYPFLVDYVRRRIDLGNIKLFCRAKYLGLPKERLKAQLVPGGTIEPRVFVDGYELSLAEMCDRHKTSPYCELMTRGTDALEESETFVVLERGSEDFLMARLRGARQFTFGPEPVFAYGEAKRKEIGLVRLLGVGKITLLPPELLKERISDTYV